MLHLESSCFFHSVPDWKICHFTKDGLGGTTAPLHQRYGWVSNPEPNVCKICPTSLHTEDNLLARENDNVDATGGEPSKDHPLVPNEPLNQGAGAPTMLVKAIEAADKDTPTKFNGASLSWLDSISNISFGALLSRASPTQEISRGHSLPKTNFHHIHNCDTFDAEIAAYTARQQGASTSILVSSIFDVEQTCHTFPLQQTSLSGKEIPPSSKDYPCASDNQNMDTNLMRFHKMTEVAHTQADTNREYASGQQPHTAHDGRLESIAEMQPDPRDGANEESIAELQQNANDWGMMTMFGPESLGPWQYTAPSSTQIVGGDNVGLSCLFESSLDTFQSFSIF